VLLSWLVLHWTSFLVMSWICIFIHVILLQIYPCTWSFLSQWKRNESKIQEMHLKLLSSIERKAWSDNRSHNWQEETQLKMKFLEK
jgi:hypothetical protein